MQVEITYSSACSSYILELGKKLYQLTDIRLYREPDIVNKAIDIHIARWENRALLDIMYVPITWTGAAKYKKQNEFFLQRVSKRNNRLYHSQQFYPTGIFYMPYDWFEFEPFYYNTHHGFITEHHKQIMSKKNPSLRIEDAKYTHTTEDPEKKKQALEIFHNLINEEEQRKVALELAYNEWQIKVGEIEILYSGIDTLKYELLKLDPGKKIREEYNMVQEKLLS